jgi:hypothetical protein
MSSSRDSTSSPGSRGEAVLNTGSRGSSIKPLLIERFTVGLARHGSPHYPISYKTGGIPSPLSSIFRAGWGVVPGARIEGEDAPDAAEFFKGLFQELESQPDIQGRIYEIVQIRRLAGAGVFSESSRNAGRGADRGKGSHPKTFFCRSCTDSPFSCQQLLNHITKGLDAEGLT